MPIDPAVIGREYPPFEVRVDATKIREFSQSLRDENPLHVDESSAAAGPYGALVAPPTFSRNFWWEGFGVHEDLGFDWERVLHGQQEFEYLRPLTAGSVLTATMTVTESFEKRGRRGGSMTFAVIETVYRDRAGDVVLVGRRTLIETEAPEGDGAGDVAGGPTPPVVARIAGPDDVEVGSAPVPLVIGPLTRTDLVRYAGASGDFNPIHHDDHYAIRAGNERVFAMGMLAGGYLGRLLEGWFGEDALRRFTIRFTSRAWPGDVLTCRARIEEKYLEGDLWLARCDAWVENQHGERVIAGDAVALLGGRPAAAAAPSSA